MELSLAFWLFYQATGGWPSSSDEIMNLYNRFKGDPRWGGTDVQAKGVRDAFSQSARLLGGREGGAMPSWALSLLGRELGAAVGYLLVSDLAPIVIEAAGENWTEDKTRAAVESTEWWRQNTERQRNWPRLSEGEKQHAITEAATRFANALRGVWGPEEFDRRWPGGLSNADILAEGEGFASGRSVLEASLWQQTRAAEQVQGTPAWNALAEERRQIGAAVSTIENLQVELEATWREWLGDNVPLPTNMRQWAGDIFENKTSRADYDNWVKEQSSELYPTKPQNISFRLWVGRPKALIQEALELGVVADDDPLLISYARGEISLADLDSRLRRDPRFEGTQRSQQAGRGLGLGITQVMGF